MHPLAPLVLAAGCALAGVAAAAPRPLDLTLNAGAASDYVFRGVSQTRGRPQAFGGADVAFGGIGYAGVWASNVDFGDSTGAEYDLYAGVKPMVGPVNLDLGVLRYGYTNAPSGAKLTHYEAKAAASMSLGPATLGGAFFFSPDAAGPGRVKSYYYELNGAVPSPIPRLSLSAAIGRQSYDGPGDYTTWDLGASYALSDRLGVDLRYWDTDEHRFGKAYKARVVASLRATF
jgi:uncharacterized protein (TIGR02001 family)